MIKTRGYRVELGEIEAVMVAHPAVDEAVALPIPDEAIGNTIHAVVTLADSATLDSKQLKATLRGKAAGLHGARENRIPKVAAANRQRKDRPPASV